MVRYHYQTDRHHRNYARIYQFTTRFISPGGDAGVQAVPYAFGKAVRNDNPGIEQLAMLEEWYSPLLAVPVANGADKKIKEKDHPAAFVEPAYFRIFDYTCWPEDPTPFANPARWS